MQCSDAGFNKKRLYKYKKNIIQIREQLVRESLACHRYSYKNEIDFVFDLGRVGDFYYALRRVIYYRIFKL